MSQTLFVRNEINKIGPPLSVVSDCLRGFLIAGPGKKLIAMDFNAIEARVLAWLAGEESVLQVFRTHGKIYEQAAAGIYRVPMSEVTPEQRQVGKVAILALGYAGGKGAFSKMAEGYGIKVTESEAETIKLAWRAANPKIVGYWRALKVAAMEAVICPGVKTTAGHPGRHVVFKKDGSFLWCKLPSGRVLCYPFPRIEMVDAPWTKETGQKVEALTYMCEEKFQWTRVATHGGVLAENCFGAETKIFTDKGLKNIADIDLSDRIWDGVEYVAHTGVVSNGRQEALLWQGIQVTPNHLMTDGSLWHRVIDVGAQQLQDVLSFGRDSAPLWWKIPEGGMTQKLFAGAIAAILLKLKRGRSFAKKLDLPARIVTTKKAGKNAGNFRNFFRPRNFRAFGCTAIAELFRGVTTPRAKHSQITVGGGSGFGRFGDRIEALFLPTSSRLKIGMQPDLTSIGSTTTVTMSRKICALSIEKQIQEIGATPNTLFFSGKKLFFSNFFKSIFGNGKAQTRIPTMSGEEKQPSKSRTSTINVYDVTNCGPRNRFLILTAAGPMMAHNCVQAVSRDLLANAMLNLKKAGCEIILHAHDEAVIEVDADKDIFEDVRRWMCLLPEWAKDLPLAASGWQGMRYKK